jgi:hypothetical protein
MKLAVNCDKTMEKLATATSIETHKVVRSSTVVAEVASN